LVFQEGKRHLEKADFHAVVRRLAETDPGLGAIVENHGPPPFWVREPGFPTLVHIILEQQVSIASALAAFNKLKVRMGEIRPAEFIKLTDDELRADGFSRQKTRYCRIAAEAVLDGSLDLEGLAGLDDEAGRAALTALTGIGNWTADVYLQMALRRPDIWPVGDLALRAAVQGLFGLEERPKEGEMEAIGERWRPHRSAAAMILWHGYLEGAVVP
jgi:DNA-3-methyladenine glycosylase II